jgi:glycosyltransferase involved in cell wall biosynthesis
MNISLVIPVNNEEESLAILHGSIREALDGLGHVWEVVYVDDGSSDGSLAILEQVQAEDPEHVRVVALRRNFGQTAAVAAGIDHAIGDTIVLLDADLQNDPADIPMMLSKLEEGYDVVSGWRYDRSKPTMNSCNLKRPTTAVNSPSYTTSAT